MTLLRYSRWDGTQTLPPFDADDVLEALSDDILAEGDIRRALQRLMQRGMRMLYRPAAVARCKYVVTVPSPTVQACAIARWFRPASCLRRRTSRSFLISSLEAAILGTFLFGKPQGSFSYR